MKLKISYNEDKSRVFVTITVPRAKKLREEKLYMTTDVVKILNDMDVPVTYNQCIKRAKVFNYSSKEQRTGTWAFLMPKTEKTEQEPEQPQVAVPQVIEPKPAPKLRPRRNPTSRRPSPRRPERKDAIRRKNPKRN